MKIVPIFTPLIVLLPLLALLPSPSDAYVYYEEHLSITTEWFTVQWRTNRHVEFPDDTAASVVQCFAPVLDSVPDEAACVPVVVAPDGGLAAILRTRDVSGAILTSSAGYNSYAPAKIAAGSAWGLTTTRLECYFLRSDVTAVGDTSPACGFRMNVTAMQGLLVRMAGSDADDSPERAGPTRAVADLDIDKNGKITSMNGVDKAGELLVQFYLRKFQKSMVFTPATHDGQPVPAKLRLVVRAGQRSGIPPIGSRDKTAFEKPLPVPWQGQPLEVTAYLEYNGDGTVDTVRLPDSLDKTTALALLHHLALT
ncbi:MAG: hypothetical protein WC360_03870, partial [Opitutales bacterium]